MNTLPATLAAQDRARTQSLTRRLEQEALRTMLAVIVGGGTDYQAGDPR